ncbi:MAG TPA: hypothetical protein VK805_03155 [Candidatus Baltobacteraceae bacterium]|nr:hypothetical protein [Candidatus Baltobacteraceae bacterium]
MRILLDECIDERFRNSLSPHDCQTARFAGLAGLENGELLASAEAARFDIFLTVDQGIEYQQNLRGRQIAALVFARKVESPQRPVGSRACMSVAHRNNSTRPNR